MKKWIRCRRTCLLLLALTGVLVASYFEPTRCVHGWLWGEAFFDGRPTSYWRRELERWDVNEIVFPWGRSEYSGRLQCYFSRKPTWFDKIKEPWQGFVVAIPLLDHGPKLLDGDENASPVLHQLLADRSPQIRRFARIGLKMEAE